MTTADADLALPVGTTTKPGGGRSMAKYSAQQMRAMVGKGQAMKDASGAPSYPIADAADLSNAIRAVGRGGADHDSIRAHIIRRARALGKSDQIPENWNSDGSMTQESTLAPVLLLEGTIPQPVILQEATAENGGVMKIRVPFYVGESIARAPGFNKPIYFPKSQLPDMIQEGKRQISEGKQPLTTYARHNHADDGDHLPVGAVVDLEQDGRIGYATIEVSPTSTGKDVQVLAQNKHLNAVSLRSGIGKFQMEDRKVNGTPMHVPTRLHLSGIDFAPDSPAQPTYGIQVLQEDARVEAAPTPNPTPKRRSPTVPDIELTLDSLRSEYPELVAEMEAPLRKEINALTSERNVLQAEKTARRRDEQIRDFAADFPEPDKALPLLQEACADCQTDEEVAVKVVPILRKAMAQMRPGPAPTVAKPAEQILQEMFRPGGSGDPNLGLNQEGDKPSDIDSASLVGVDVAEV